MDRFSFFQRFALTAIVIISSSGLLVGTTPVPSETNQKLRGPPAVSAIPADWKSYINSALLRGYIGTNGGDKFDASSGLFEGDIVGPERGYSQTQLANFAKSLSSDARIRWSGGIVPIAIRAQAFSPEEVKIIRGAMAAISRQTNSCINFVDRTNQADFLEFVKDLSSCFSPVGRQSGKQTVSLTSSCIQNLGDIQHEIMHALGFLHETSRLDRDNFVWINWENIQKDHLDQFQMYYNGTIFDLPYDYESILHFPFNAFAIDNEKPTVVPKAKNSRIGLNKNLSPGDVLKIKKAYNCDKQDSAPAPESPVAPDSPASSPSPVAENEFEPSKFFMCRFYSNSTKSCQSQCLSDEESEENIPNLSRGRRAGQVRLEYINDQFIDPIFHYQCTDSAISSHWDSDQGFFADVEFSRADQRRGLYAGSCIFYHDDNQTWSCRGCDHYNDDVLEETSVNCISGANDTYQPNYKRGWQQEDPELNPEAITIIHEEEGDNSTTTPETSSSDGTDSPLHSTTSKGTIRSATKTESADSTNDGGEDSSESTTVVTKNFESADGKNISDSSPTDISHGRSSRMSNSKAA